VQAYHAESGFAGEVSNRVRACGQEGLQLAFGLYRGNGFSVSARSGPAYREYLPYGENEFHTFDLEETDRGIMFDLTASSAPCDVDLFLFQLTTQSDRQGVHLRRDEADRRACGNMGW